MTDQFIVWLGIVIVILSLFKTYDKNDTFVFYIMQWISLPLSMIITPMIYRIIKSYFEWAATK